jgi:peroxiredoxin
VQRRPIEVTVGERVPDGVADARVLDASGAELEVGSLWERSSCLLVLVRRFGCVGCAEQVRELAPRLFELSRAGVRTVLVGNGSVEERAAFAARNALEGAPALLLTDPSLSLYRALGLVRSAWATVRPRSLLETARAIAAGYAHRRAEGDRTQQGGVLLVDRAGVVRLFHRSRSIGDHPPASDLVDAALRLAVAEHEPGATV